MTNRTRAVGGSFLTGDASPEACFTPEEFDSDSLLMGRTASEFLQSGVLPHIDRIEAGDHALMHSLMQQAGELGLLGADVPVEFGGLGLPQTTAALIAEQINFQQSFALTHEAHTVIGTFPLLLFGSEDQKRRYLPKLASGEWIASFALSETGSGSDALALQTRAELDPATDSWILNGEKMWITNTAFADLFTVFARTGPAEITAFLVERTFPGVSFGKEEHKLGMHGTSTRRVILEDVRVPAANALERGKGHYAALCALNMGRFKLEAGAVGGVKAVIRFCHEYTSQRKAFGAVLGDFGLVQAKLADMAARAFALESMVYRLASDIDSHFEAIDPISAEAPALYHRAAEEMAIECNIVKVVGSELYSDAADDGIQLHGGYGYTEEFPAARAWRDQRLLRIGEGANEIVRLAIVNTLLRRDAQKRLDVLRAGDTAAATCASRTLDDASDPDSALDELRCAACAAKELALLLITMAVRGLGDALGEAQEIVAACADVVCSAYALDSMYARAAKMAAATHPRAAVALLAAQVAGRWHADRAAGAVREALDSMPEIADDALAEGIVATIEGLDPWSGNPMELRRALAAEIRDRSGYPL